MRKPTPKTYRKIKRRPIVLVPGVRVSEFDVVTVTIESNRRSDRLPPYGEYNPNRVHVARRRRAHKENKEFPRGWTWASEVSESHVSDDAIQAIASGGWTTCKKVSEDEWELGNSDFTIEGSITI